MKKNDIKFIVQSAIIAALYVVFTLLFAPISYGAIQFRISEVLILLVVLNPKYFFSLVVGCFVANSFSSLGWYDMLFGTLATILALLPMLKIKKLYIASIFPVISNAFIVSIELGLAFNLFAPAAFWFNVLTVAIGEAVVLYFLGIPLMHLLCQNKSLVETMALDKGVLTSNSFFTFSKCLISFFGSLGIIFYLAYPLANDLSALEITFNNLWAMSMGIIPFLIIVIGLFTKGKTRFLLGILSAIGLLINYILIGVYINQVLSYIYYYGYSIYLLILVFIFVYVTKRKLR